jgi:hypothetical protein
MTVSTCFALSLACLLPGVEFPLDAHSPAQKHCGAVAHGWLYPSSRSRLVRFVSETKVEGNDKVFVPFQTTGFIFILKDTFSISVAEPLDVLLFKYKDGSLSRTGSDFAVDRHPKRLSFSDAISGVLNEVVCEGLGVLCKWLLSHKECVPRSGEKWGLLPNFGMYEAVVGNDPGDLQKFTVTWPNTGSGFEKTVCTFTVVLR